MRECQFIPSRHSGEVGSFLCAKPEMEIEIKRLAAENAALRADAERYRKVLTAIRVGAHCTKMAPFEYDADHRCIDCGHSSAYDKDIIDEALAGQPKAQCQHDLQVTPNSITIDRTPGLWAYAQCRVCGVGWGVDGQKISGQPPESL